MEESDDFRRIKLIVQFSLNGERRRVFMLVGESCLAPIALWMSHNTAYRYYFIHISESFPITIAESTRLVDIYNA